MTSGRRVDPLPFLRRGQSEGLRRGRRKKTVRWALMLMVGLWGIGLFAGIAYAGRHYLTHSLRFAFRQIDLSPTTHAPRKELLEVAGRFKGRNLFRLDVGSIAAELEQVRWVKTASVKRILPDRLHCAIEERIPRGLARLEDRIWLVDEEGVAIDLYGKETLEYSFPIFTGIDPRDEPRSREQIRRGVALLDYLEQVEPGLPAQISEIDLRSDDRISLHMTAGGPEVRVHPSDFGSNLERYLTMRDYLSTHFGDGAYVDLRFRDSISFQTASSRRP